MDEILSAAGLSRLLRTAFEKRESLMSDPDNNAFRMFNGFFEGQPAFSIDRYADTAVILWASKKIRADNELRAVLSENQVR